MLENKALWGKKWYNINSYLPIAHVKRYKIDILTKCKECINDYENVFSFSLDVIDGPKANLIKSPKAILIKFFSIEFSIVSE